MKKKTFILPVLVLSVFFWSCGGASASVYTITDNTLVIGKHSRPDPSPNTNPNLYSYTGWQDVITNSSKYGVYGIDAVRSGHMINFKLYTNFSGSGMFTTATDPTTYIYSLADFAIDSNQDGRFNYGVVLQDHSDWFPGVLGVASTLPTAPGLTAGLYSVDSWDSPSHFFNEPSDFKKGGINYGQYYKKAGSSNATARTSVVAIAGGTSLGDLLSFGRTNRTGVVNPEYIYSFSLNADHIGVFNKPFNVFWGGANCSFDAIAGTVPVPEPATIILFGVGLIGMAVTGRRKFKMTKALY